MISFAENFLDIIRAEAEAAFPNECCGLLAGTLNGTDIDDILITRVVPSPNTKVDAHGGGRKHFEIDPKIHFDLLREIKSAPEKSSEIIIGHYHSHPGKPAEPSVHDIDNALEPEQVWLIISVDENGRAKDLGAFRLNGESRNVTRIKIMQ